MIIILDVKTIFVRVHLIGTGAIGPRQTLIASNDWNKLDLSIRQSPSLASFKRVLRNVNSF